MAIPKLTYALDVWYTPVRLPEGKKRRVGSVQALKTLVKAQRVAALAISGAMHTTANDTLDIHAGLPPLEFTLDFICHRNAVRAATLPKEHPVGNILTWTHYYQGRHTSPIIALMRLYSIKPTETEIILSTSHRRLGDQCPVSTHIAPTREGSKEQEAVSTANFKLYVDGSGYEGGTGAAAVVMRHGEEISAVSHSLGPLTHYTTFDAEAVGLLLAANEILSRNLHGKIDIYMDNQSVIQRMESGKKGTGQYILKYAEEALSLAAKRAKDTNSTLDMKLRWISAHDDVAGNERADTLAKEAATGKVQPAEYCPLLLHDLPKLPHSKAAVRKEAHQQVSLQWEAKWKKSTHRAKLERVDPGLKIGKYLDMVGDWKKNRTSIITQLRTGHIPLNYHLHRIKKADSPLCPHCNNKEETVRHFLTECPAYDIERKELQNGCRNYDLPLKVLLATAEGMKATIEYVQHTKRFKKPFGSFEGDLVAPRRAAVLREKRERQEEKKRRKEEKKGR